MLKMVIHSKIISGFHKNEIGEIIKVNLKTGKVIS